MSLNIGFALLTVLVTIYALIKRYETRFVLLAAGFAMAIFSLKPMIAFQQFDASMTKIIFNHCDLLRNGFCRHYLFN